MRGKILVEIIWRSSAIQHETDSQWNFGRTAFNSKPQQAIVIKIRTSNMLNKTRANKQSASLFQKLLGILCL